VQNEATTPAQLQSTIAARARRCPSGFIGDRRDLLRRDNNTESYVDDDRPTGDDIAVPDVLDFPRFPRNVTVATVRLGTAVFRQTLPIQSRVHRRRR
jgi:hypothetical protein